MDYGLNFLRFGPLIPPGDHPYPFSAFLALPLALSAPAPEQIAARSIDPKTGTEVELRVTEHPGNLLPPRRMNVALALVTLLLAGTVIARRFGTWVGFGFFALGTIDPGWIAQARFATTDIAHGSSFVLGALAIDQFRATGRWRWTIAAGLACALGMSAKFSGIILIPGAFAVALFPGDDPEPIVARLRKATLAAFITMVVGVAAYISLFFVHGVLGLAPLGSGASHLSMAMESFVKIRSMARGTFLLGQFHPDGTWMYFPILLAAKTPLALWAVALSSLATAEGRRLLVRHGPLFMIPLLYLIVAMGSGVNLGHRHLTPVLFGFWLAGSLGLVGLARTLPIGRLAAVGAVALVTLESGFAHPHYLPFTNAAFGGIDGAHKVAVDSASDWGQDLPNLRAWLTTNHQGAQVHLAYFGTADPAALGIPHIWRPCGTLGRPRPRGAPAADCRSPAKILAVSATCLQGSAGGSQRNDCYDWLRDRTPAAILGGSILVYQDAVLNDSQ
jgi:hypothetical protein